jgi:hypothetical protein
MWAVQLVGVSVTITETPTPLGAQSRGLDVGMHRRSSHGQVTVAAQEGTKKMMTT